MFALFFYVYRLLCLDHPLLIDPENCLVYSFGIGNDFSFEKVFGLFGCDVYAFDDDNYHADYPLKPFYRCVNPLSLLQVREPFKPHTGA